MQTFKNDRDFERAFAQFKRDVHSSGLSYESEQSIKDTFRDRALELLKYIIEDKYGAIETIYGCDDRETFYSRDYTGIFILNGIKYGVRFWWDFKRATIVVIESEADRWNRSRGKDRDFQFEINMFRCYNIPKPKKFKKGDLVLHNNKAKFILDYSYAAKKICYYLGNKPTDKVTGWDYVPEGQLKSLEQGV
jgi:hypothetical protein